MNKLTKFYSQNFLLLMLHRLSENSVTHAKIKKTYYNAINSK